MPPARAMLESRRSRVACTGSPATANRKPRQARKGAAVVVTPGAGVKLVRAAALLEDKIHGPPPAVSGPCDKVTRRCDWPELAPA